MKKIIIILIVLLSVSTINAQSWLWTRNITGTTANDNQRAVECDQYNNVYVIGTFMGTMTFDATHTLTAAATCTDIYIAKYDKDNNFQWVIQGITTIPSLPDFARNIVFDNFGNLYVAGDNSQTTSFGSVVITPTTSGTNSGFILKVTTSGIPVSAIEFAYGSPISTESIAIDASNNITVVSGYAGTLNINGSTETWPIPTLSNHFIVQYSNTFNLNWAKVYIHNCYITNFQTIKSCNNQGFYIGGFLRASLTIDSITLSSRGGMLDNDIFIMKIDNLGNTQWIRQAGSNTLDRCYDIAVDINDNVYLTGYFTGTTISPTKFDSTGTALFDSRGYISSGGNDLFVAKYNSQGTLQWVRKFGDSNSQTGYGIEVKDSNVFVTGSFEGSLIFNNTITTSSNSNLDVFVGKMDLNGNPKSCSIIGGTANVEDRGESIAIDNNENTYICGYYNSNPLLVGNYSLTPNVTPDIFIAKFGQIKITSIITNASCNGINDGSIDLTVSNGESPYTFNWGGGITTEDRTNITSGIYTVTVTDANLISATSIVEVENSKLSSISQTSLSATLPNICQGDLTTLNITGGYIGLSASWLWYSSSCGGNTEGNGSFLTVAPIVTTEYYVRAEGTCNTTTCISITITVNSNSSGASYALASSEEICEGESTTLGISDGGLGTGGEWYWYSGSCGGIKIGSGSTIIVNPTTDTDYYVRAEGTCNTTTCENISIVVDNNSEIPSSVSANLTTICTGYITTLGISGGSLGTGASWKWYSGTCGGTIVGNGAQIYVAPTTSISYFVRAEGTCNTTTCKSISIMVATYSFPSNSASATLSTICDGQSTSLQVNGGTLGIGAQWYWRTTGGILIGTGSTIIVSPTSTIDYYVRAEGTCNTTIYENVTISVNTNSSSASLVTTSQNKICNGDLATLGIIGGNLGTGATWNWYNASCGGTIEGNGAIINITPSVTTNYYVRAEGICNTTACISITISVGNYSIVATSATATSATICEGESTTLGITGGNLDINANWNWYSSSCGGTFIESGAALTVNPTVTTAYYVRAEGICNTTACANIIITVNTVSVPVNSITSTTTTICEGGSTTLGITGGNLGIGANWNWYSNSCGGTLEGNGSILVASPSFSKKYYIRAEGVCNTTLCISKTVIINQFCTPASSASASPTLICSGSTSTLSVSGYVLGSNSNWYWYSGSCGGIFEGIGENLTVNPSVTTQYFVRAQGVCNTTTCVSVILLSNSLAPTSISANPSIINLGSTSMLTINGGVLGSIANWRWYSGSCGSSNYYGINPSIVVMPTATTTYFVRATGVCNTTVCVSKTVEINSISVSTPATSATAYPHEICNTSNIRLTAIGGSLVSGASWKWYSGTCGGTYKGIGSIIFAQTSTTTTYFVRAESISNTTSCVSATVTVYIPSTPVTSVLASSTSICSGSSSTLSFTGGNLGSYSTWNWYSNSCEGVFLGTGTTLIVNPTISTNYYVRAEGICNYTTCDSIYISTISNLTSPISASANPSTICQGSSSILSFTDSSLAIGTDWKWYSASCGGIFVGIDTSITVSPTISTTYYVRAEGTCNTTACVSVIVSVNNISINPLLTSATPSSICVGSISTLSLTGGSLGLNANWNWYESTCGGTSLGIGAIITNAPTTSTTYFVRAEGTCNTTACDSIVVSVSTSSINLISASAIPSIICQGSSSILSFTDSSLAIGTNWKWYSVSCGGTFVGIDTSITVSPTISTTYYVRAEGTCNTTACVSVIVSVNNISINPLLTSATPSSICLGSISTLSLTGGSLGLNANWNWYSASCGGTFVGIDTSITVSPTISTTYYVRAEGTCNTTACDSIVVLVSTYSINPISASTTPSIICEGTSSTLNVNGGSLGIGSAWTWYTSSCGGTNIGAGIPFTVSPTVTTTYYVRAEGACNTTACINTTVYLYNNSITPTSSIANPSIVCSGGTSTLSFSGGTLGNGANWFWDKGSCGGTSIGIGSSISVHTTIETTYYVRAEGTCNTTACTSITVSLNASSIDPLSATANPYYISSGSSTTIDVAGGSLGTDAKWMWYSGSCGGTYETSGLIFIASPTINTIYYVRAEGFCNTTTCVSEFVKITIQNTQIIQVGTTTLSITPTTSAYATPSSICKGSSTTLSVNGSLEIGAIWKWYSSSCGGTTAGVGTNITVNPTISTTYYVRAEGIYNTTNCVNTIVTVNTNSINPISASTTPSVICEGSSSTLNVNGGSLGIGSTWTWYTGSCGGTNIGAGIPFIVSPSVTTTYYVRGEGACNTTACINTTVHLYNNSITPTSSIANPSIVCSGGSSTLSFSGGTLGNGANWFWDKGSCGGTSIGIGSSISVTTTIETTYFVRAEGTCNTTACTSITVSLNTTSIAPISVTATPLTILAGSTTTLGVSGGSLGTDANWKWYAASCGGTYISSDSAPVVSPTTTTIYYVRAEGACNTTICKYIKVRVIKGEEIENNSENGNIVSVENTANSMVIYPNPANDIVNINYNLSEKANVNITIYDVLGNKMKDVINESKLSGKYNTELNLSSLPSGIYLCKITLNDNNTITKRLVISR